MGILRQFVSDGNGYFNSCDLHRYLPICAKSFLTLAT